MTVFIVEKNKSYIVMELALENPGLVPKGKTAEIFKKL